MYGRILLAYDGTVEGRAALREGALLAKLCRARVFLLSIIAETPGSRMAETAHVGVAAHLRERYEAVLEEGAAKLKSIGLVPEARLVIGGPAQEISAFAREIGADLVVVGHRRQSLLERWWSGSSGAYLVDNIDCSLLIGRNVISDEQFQAVLSRSNEPA